jgi:hypothetical protein
MNKMDLCVFLSGLHLDVYTPLFFETLFMNCDTSNLSVHVVEKGRFEYPGILISNELDMKYYVPGVGDNVHDYLLRKKEASPIPFNIYEMHDPSVFFRNTTPHPPFYHMADDHANTLNWAMEHCGTDKWIIFCHSDMIFKKDFITYLSSHLHDFVGMWGCYCYCFAVNRDAFLKIGIKFNNISNFRAVPVKHNGFDFEIKYEGDPDCPQTKTAPVVYGWDVGELLQLMMVANNWLCETDRERNNCHLYLDHMCSGHGYVSDETRRFQEARRQAWMKEFNVQRC